MDVARRANDDLDAQRHPTRGAFGEREGRIPPPPNKPTGIGGGQPGYDVGDLAPRQQPRSQVDLRLGTAAP
jgi:hypothetical protein